MQKLFNEAKKTQTVEALMPLMSMLSQCAMATAHDDGAMRSDWRWGVETHILTCTVMMDTTGQVNSSFGSQKPSDLMLHTFGNISGMTVFDSRVTHLVLIDRKTYARFYNFIFATKWLTIEPDNWLTEYRDFMQAYVHDTADFKRIA